MEKKKVLLLNPLYSKEFKVIKTGQCQIKVLSGLAVWPPIDLGGIASLLIERGFRVKILDASVGFFSFKDMLSKISNSSSCVHLPFIVKT